MRLRPHGGALTNVKESGTRGCHSFDTLTQVLVQWRFQLVELSSCAVMFAASARLCDRLGRCRKRCSPIGAVVAATASTPALSTCWLPEAADIRPSTLTALRAHSAASV